MVNSTINQWGNGLAVRLTKATVRAAGAGEGTPIRVSAVPGRITIDIKSKEPTLDEMLAKFDPARHGGEAMALKPAGKEIL